jgi:hypothetical protein
MCFLVLTSTNWQFWETKEKVERMRINLNQSGGRLIIKNLQLVE